jgi:plastin-1
LNLRKAGKDISLFQINENQTLVIASAKAIGVKVTNVGASELVEGEKYPHLVLGLGTSHTTHARKCARSHPTHQSTHLFPSCAFVFSVWQLVKIHLLNSINLKNHPELIRLLEEGETLADLLKLPPDQLLIRWFNVCETTNQRPWPLASLYAQSCAIM